MNLAPTLRPSGPKEDQYFLGQVARSAGEAVEQGASDASESSEGGCEAKTLGGGETVEGETAASFPPAPAKQT